MSEAIIELLGWVATTLLLCGYYLNAKKLIVSWPIWFIGNFIMLIYALFIGSYSIAFLSVILLGLNVYGWVSWQKNE